MKRRRKAHARAPRRPVALSTTHTVAQTVGSGEPATRRRGPAPHVDSRSWFRVENSAAAGGAAAVYIYDEIGGWGVTASDFMDALRGIGTPTIELHLNSPGGDVFDGIAIFNCLRNHPARVEVVVDSLAASAASVIAQAGDTVTMMPGSQMMIHDASGLCIGNASDMAEMARMLEQQSDNIAGIYAHAAGGTAAEWRERMRAETWFMAEEAVAAGLADRVASDAPPATAPEARAATVRPVAAAHAPAPAADPGHSSETLRAAEREPDYDLADLDLGILDGVFAEVRAEMAAPPPDPVANAWNWADLRGLLADAARSAPAAPARPVSSAPTGPDYTLDPVDIRVALKERLVLR